MGAVTSDPVVEVLIVDGPKATWVSDDFVGEDSTDDRGHQ